MKKVRNMWLKSCFKHKSKSFLIWFLIFENAGHVLRRLHNNKKTVCCTAVLLLQYIGCFLPWWVHDYTCLYLHGISLYSHVFQAQNLEKGWNLFQCPKRHFSADFILCKKKDCFQKHQSEKFNYSIEKQLFETEFGQDSV